MKKSVKKLELSKMTIANLNTSEMNQKVAGYGSFYSDCTDPIKKIPTKK